MPQSRNDLGLQGRFLLGLAIILFGVNLFIACAIYFWGKQTIEQDALRQTELVLAAVDAVRGYVREELRPRMYELLGEDHFVLEAMSTSYVSTAVMERFRRRMPNFLYRRVSTAPLNAASHPNRLEEEMMAYFTDHPDRKNWQGIHSLDGVRYFMRFEPISFGQDCFRCHGSRGTTPPEILQRYPDAHFLNSQSTPRGLISLAIPLDTSLLQIKDRAFSVFAFAFCCLLLLYGMISFFFDRIVVQSLRGLLALFRQNLRDNHGEQLYRQASSKDAIYEFTAAAEAMADYIRETDSRLTDYANNLEHLVEERTSALRLSQNMLRQKIQARNRELLTMNNIAELITRSPDLQPILPKIIDCALTVVPANGAALYLLRHQQSALELQAHCGVWNITPPAAIELAATNSARENLSGALLEAARGEMGFLASEREKMDALTVPLSCRGNIHGVMIFVEVDFMELDTEVTTLLSSIGRQAGILIESIRNVYQLTSNATLLQSVVDGISDMVVLLDHEGRVRMVNRSFKAAYPQHRPGDRLPPASPFVALGPAPRFPDGKALHKIVRQGNGIVFDLHYYPIIAADGQVEQVVGLAKDITQQQRGEARRQETEKLAAIGQLAAGVAHEINNPLGVILCHADLARGDIGAPDELRRDLAIIEKHAKTCKKIIADLLNFARREQSRKEPSPINDLISEVAAMMRRQLEKDGITLAVDLDATIPDLSLDREKIRQVLVNLIINAAQAIGSTGTITLRTTLNDDNDIQITVEDDGPGIAAAIKEQIFEPFFSTKTPGQGTGLGLSVSYGIVREHGGTIVAENRPEGGARMTLTFPAPMG